MTEIATRTRAGVYRIEDLASLVAQGRLRVPEFQRNFRWVRKDVLNLFDSILKGYPIGSLLLWSRPAGAAQVRLGELSIPAPETTEAMWVVDGQQRITAIANAVDQLAYDASERFRIDFDLAKNEFVPGGGGGDEPRVPLPVLFDLRRLLEWAQARPDAACAMLAPYVSPAQDGRDSDTPLRRPSARGGAASALSSSACSRRDGPRC
ncbi:DUF262 domain-containing protein [Propionicicella superfundia]|uniref:DUF262 domain-containing protein n=1 Tax=Propionicicella superfundia TaxID=348582 RepID=UPI000413C810|nr:DUF262 domain-containing protein [Propionicicella superfundia]